MLYMVLWPLTSWYCIWEKCLGSPLHSSILWNIIWALPQTVVLIYVVLQVQGVVQDKNGKTVATLFGKWDESMHFMNGDGSGKGKGSELQLLWKRSKPPKYQTRYNFSRFAITLNELSPELKVVVRKLISFSYVVIFFFLVLFFTFFLNYSHKPEKICTSRI